MKKILSFLCEIFKTAHITVPEAGLTTQLLTELNEAQLERLGTSFCYLVQLAEQNIYLKSTSNNIDGANASFVQVIHQKDQDHSTALVDIWFIREQRRGGANIDGYSNLYNEEA